MDNCITVKRIHGPTMAVISRIIYLMYHIHIIRVISDIISYSFSMHEVLRRISHKVHNKSKYHLATADTMEKLLRYAYSTYPQVQI